MSEWKKGSLGQLAEIVKGDQVNSDTLDQTGKYPVINGGTEPSGYLDRWNRESGSITISEGGNSCGFVSLMRQRFWSGGHCYTLRNVRIYNTYLYHFLKYTQQDIMKLRVGSGLPNIQRNDISEHEIYYPTDNNEQVEIAGFLSTIDEVIEKTEAAIEKYKAIKAGMMQDLFTRGIDVKTGKLRPSFKEAPELYKETELGWIPKEWEVCTIKEACLEFVNGGTPSTKNAANWVGTIPWITGADFLDTFEVGVVRRQINEEALRNSSSHLIRKGNILLVTRTGVGKLAIAPFDVAISQDITGIILDPSTYCVEFFYYYLQILVENFKKINQGTSINGIIRSDLEATTIVKPPIEEQKQIADVLKTLDVALKNEQRDLNKYRDLKQGLMADLLTGKVRVKINEDILENS
ncbi:MAG: restriction endonuclease subunit S [Candidatus Cloacimonetes bacterium]|nr:restriction endonuclease subunit S [Candidatus Cloacimonadota bacterium]